MVIFDCRQTDGLSTWGDISMRTVILAASAALMVGGCATAPPTGMSKAGLSVKQQAADRAHCHRVGQASRNSEQHKQQREASVNAAMIGSVIGFGIIGGIVAYANKDAIAQSADSSQTNGVARACLERKGYKE
jgi:hypothetical protein